MERIIRGVEYGNSTLTSLGNSENKTGSLK